MIVDFSSFASNVASLARVALRSFLLTVAVVFAVGMLLAGASYWILQDDPLYAVIAAGIALAEALTAGVVLGSKRAVIMSLAHGLHLLRLGRLLVRILFERLLGISSEHEHGQRGGWLAQGLERLPLAQVEQALKQAVHDLMNAQPTQAGIADWLRSRVQGNLLALVARYTLARFREESAAQGGVDLVKMQAELESQIDEVLIGKLRRGVNLWTLLVLLGLPVVVGIQTLGVWLYLTYR